MSIIPDAFPYPSLTVEEDSIRILSIEPGDFSQPLICKLEARAFSTRPEYIALSYTWGDPYPDNTILPTSPKPKDLDLSSGVDLQNGGFPTITLNNRQFPVHHNLFLAILHLRSPTYPLAIWADAICINQANKVERNTQVSIMSFIYKRALKVVTWLGVKEYNNQGDPFHSMQVDWKLGQVRLLAASLTGAIQLNYSMEPDQRTMARIAENPYWSRVWIVQEACLARDLVFAYGSKIWRFEELEQWTTLNTAGLDLKTLSTKSGDSLSDKGKSSILRLIVTRKARHKDEMRLETLIELFAKNKCTEVRDRIYGLLGLANDIYPLTKINDAADLTEEYVHQMDFDLEIHSRPKRGRGTFKVDYSQPLYDVWADVVKFALFRAKSLEGIWTSDFIRRTEEISGLNTILKEGRRITVVRTAGIVQAALDQKVEEEMVEAAYPKESTSGSSIINAVGYLSAKILHLGPSYTSFIGSFRAQQDWINCWEDHYDKPTDFEILRSTDESYTAEIMRYQERDLARIREIKNPHTMAWGLMGSVNPNFSYSEYLFNENNTGSKEEQGQLDEPVLCLGTDHLIGLVPSAAKIGDFIIQFWNCNAAIVVRPISPETDCKRAGTSNPSFRLVGRADVAEVIDRKITPGFDGRAEEAFLGNLASTPTGRSVISPTGSNVASGAVCVEMDLLTLQMITAFTTT